MKFGDVLRQAREQSGEDLVSVARRIRIRPDILERIEESDIDSMPPHGYSRNMINAYARYLGLNTTEVVKMYQTAQYSSQVQHARENMKPAGFEMPATRRSAVFDRAHDHERPSVSRNGETASSGASSHRSSNGFDEGLFDDIDAAIAPPKDSGNRIGAVHVGSYNAYGQGLSQRNARRSNDATRRIEPVENTRRHDGRSTHRARRSNMPGEHYTNLYAAPKNIGVRTSGIGDKLPFIIAGIVILLLVVVFAAWANGVGRAQDQEPAAAPLNITGLPGSSSSDGDASSGESESADSTDAADAAAEAHKEDEAAKAAALAPTKTVMAYEIPSGVTTYFEVYLDGKYVDGGDVTGPKSGSFDVTGTFEFRVTPPDGVKLTQDGTEVALEPGSSGVTIVDVDFADVLAKWSEENAAPAADGASAGAAAASA
ncbi:MAG: helix-turn-helix transcriptional regulator [Slackia sp.]|nr:helix-turn-helix transcriptional regulator [Slackia sp.]